jgi:hypothetical protein
MSRESSSAGRRFVPTAAAAIRSIQVGALLALASCAGPSGEPGGGGSDGSEPPGTAGQSLLLLILDTTRADAWTALPATRSVFEEHGGWIGSAVTASNITSSGTAAILQGRIVEPSGVAPLATAPILAQSMRGAGYATRFAGANPHVTWGPWLRGYEEVAEADQSDEAVVEAVDDWLDAAEPRTFVTAMLLGPHTPYEGSEHCQSLPLPAVGDGMPHAKPAFRSALRACYGEDLAILDARLAPRVAAGAEAGWGVVLVSDHGEDLWDSAELPQWGHTHRLNEQENRGVYGSIALPEPEGTVGVTADVASVLAAAAGIGGYEPQPAVSTACEDGWTPAMAEWDEAAGSFRRMEPEEAAARGLPWPSCDGGAQGGAAYVLPPPSKVAVLGALGYVQ